MNAPALIRRLQSFAQTLAVTVDGLSPDEARHKPPSGAWSILEIVCHLADEETDDFRYRLTSTLTDPTKPWPKTNPEGWAVERRYLEQDLDDAVARFVRERNATVAWLRSLRDPDWDTAYHHPTHGPVRAGELLAAWPAHDALHLRQIAKRLYELAAKDAPEYGTRYAGEWGI